MSETLRGANLNYAKQIVWQASKIFDVVARMARLIVINPRLVMRLFGRAVALVLRGNFSELREKIRTIVSPPRRYSKSIDAGILDWQPCLSSRMKRQVLDERLNPYSCQNVERATEVMARSDSEKRKAAKSLGWPVYVQENQTRVIGADKALSIVILNLNRPDLIIPLVQRLVEASQGFAKKHRLLQIIIGDTGSTDRKVDAFYRSCSDNVHIVSSLKYHFSKCNNEIFFNHVNSRCTLFLNNDIIFDNAFKSLCLMLAALENDPRTAVVGSWLSYPTGEVQHAGIDFFHSGPLKGLSFHPYHRCSDYLTLPIRQSWICPAVTGACLMIRSDVFAKVGGFDEGYRSECQDVALCLTTHRLGYVTRLVNAGRIVHLENATRPKDSEDWGDRQRFVRKWGSYVDAALT